MCFKMVLPVITEPKSNMSLTTEHGIYARQAYVDACQKIAKWAGGIVSPFLLRGSNFELRAEDIQPGLRYVIASNHQHWFDAWMILSRLPQKIWDKIGMPRAMASNRFFGYPVVGPYLRSMGSFPAKQHPTDPSGLDYAGYLLENGKSIIVFPEGHVTLHRENSARRGVKELANLPNVRIIPIHFEWARPRWRARFRIGIGKPFDGSQMTAQEILDRIYALPLR
jgi:1-acyl-sn-glycerol-3-phosphate acyltransferase